MEELMEMTVYGSCLRTTAPQYQLTSENGQKLLTYCFDYILNILFSALICKVLLYLYPF